MNDPLSAFREFAGLFAIVAVVIWGLWSARRRLRPWFLIAWGGAAAVSVPITIYLVTAARGGEFSGWGGLGLIIMLLPAAFVAALSIVALLTLAVLIPLYGFDNRPAELRQAERKAEREYRRSSEGRRERAKRDLKIYAVMLVLALLYLKFGRFRP